MFAGASWRHTKFDNSMSFYFESGGEYINMVTFESLLVFFYSKVLLSIFFVRNFFLQTLLLE